MINNKYTRWSPSNIDLSEVYVGLPYEVLRELSICEEHSELEETNAWCAKIKENKVDSSYGFLIVDGDSYPDLPNKTRKTLYKTLIRCFGTPVLHQSSHLKQDIICDIRDSGFRFEGNKDQTFYISNQEAVEHTDASELIDPVKYFSLSVIYPAFKGGATRLVSAYSLYEALNIRCKRYLPILEKEYVFDTGRGEMNKAPILFRDADGSIGFRWMRAFLENGKVHTDHWDDQTDVVLDAVTQIMEEIRIGIHLKRGDIGIFNNRALLHARDSFQDHPQYPSRWYLRSWFN